MYRNLLFYLFFVGSSVLISCNWFGNKHNELDLEVKLSADSSLVLLCNLPPDLLAEFSKHPADTSIGKRFFAVYEEPIDLDLKDLEKPLRGSYQLKDNALTFKPSEDFKKGQAYYVQIYAKNLRLNPIEMLQKDGWNVKEKPLEYKFRY